MPIQGNQDYGFSGDTGRLSSRLVVERESQDGRFFSAGKGELAGKSMVTRFKTNFHDRPQPRTGADGFSLIELIMSMALTLIILGIAVGAFTGALGSRERETSRTDALTSAQAALNIMSREIGNAGFGLTSNGIVYGDSNDKQIHFRANVENTGKLKSRYG